MGFEGLLGIFYVVIWGWEGSGSSEGLRWFRILVVFCGFSSVSGGR